MAPNCQTSSTAKDQANTGNYHRIPEAEEMGQGSEASAIVLEMPVFQPSKNEATYPKLLDAVRVLAVIHIVVATVFRTYGPGVFMNSFVENFARWGEVEFSFLLCLEAFIATASTQKVIPETRSYFLTRLSEIYPIFLFSLVCYWSLISLTNGRVNLVEAVKEALLIKPWFLQTEDPLLIAPTWFVAALVIGHLFLPAVLRLLLPTSSGTLVIMMGITWVLSSIAPLGFVSLHKDSDESSEASEVLVTFPLFHLASFFYGAFLGMLFLNSKPGSISIPIANSAASATLLAIVLTFFLQTPPHGDFFIWAQLGGMLIPFGALIYFVAIDRDLILAPLFRIYMLADSLGMVGFTAFMIQRLLVNTAGLFLSSGSTSPLFWVFIWLSLITVSMTLKRVHSFIRKNVLLPWIHSQESGPVLAIALTNPDGTSKDYPIQGPFWDNTFFATSLRLLWHYSLFVGVVGLYIITSLHLHWTGLLDVRGNAWANGIVNFLKFLALLSVPALTFCSFGLLLFPPVLRVKTPSLESLHGALGETKAKLYFRIVTRGKHPHLVRSNVRHAASVLSATLPAHIYCLEVTTDNPLDLENTCPGMALEILVPEEYTPANGCRFKARALHYAVQHSEARDEDWIVHLDEETRFDRETVRSILQHCVKQAQEVAAGIKRYGNIGQGVILYGTQEEPDNWVTTLADSVRVGDDLGKFRIQYEMNEAFIGMHGSFVVCVNAVEKLVGFDHGMPSSITEDSYFALLAMEKGINFSWIDAFMYEQSPFSCKDFMHQRCRWFVGLWLICLCDKLAFSKRIVLATFMATWSFAPMVWFSMILCLFVSSTLPYWFRIMIGAIAGVSTWNYLVGFMFTYKMSDGPLRFCVLLFLQVLLLPFFATLELAGVLHGIIKPPTTGFHVVQKESSALLKTVQVEHNTKPPCAEHIEVSDELQKSRGFVITTKYGSMVMTQQ